ncbi:hypothetical protein ACFYO7_07530 [Nocardia salmonicida]|uniref:hypothetical protein n=1 Tax=Nocardia salmonicida TaxID=53431 RepID=UPI0036B9AB87
MSVEPGARAKVLADNLATLYEAANKPTLGRIVVHCKVNNVKVADSTILDWLSGKSVPSVKSKSAFEAVIRYLNGSAARGGTAYQCPPLHHWEAMRVAAEQERRRGQGRRTPRPDDGTASEAENAARSVPLHGSLYATMVAEFIVPVDRLQGREDELALLAEFCRGDQPYLWVQGAPWSGKSALLATFALCPPPNVTVVSFFVTDRLAAQNDNIAFTNAILEQLAVLLPKQRTRIEAATAHRDGLRTELLTTAARAEAAAGRRLVLVVDGLDEDTGKPRIVDLLPAWPPENMRVLVASRLGPELPIPQRHHLASAQTSLLTPSPFAADIRIRAVAELDAVLRGQARDRELLALITAANGLSASELADLTELAPYEIDELLGTKAGRSFRARSSKAGTDNGGDPVYALAHETLQRTAEQRLGRPQLDRARQRLHAWANQYRDLGWPGDTPDFLLTRHFAVVKSAGDLTHQKRLALDTRRHDLILERTGGDLAALNEIADTQQAIIDSSDPDILAATRLARNRDRLSDRNRKIPPALPAVWARLGDPERAEVLALSIPPSTAQIEALSGLIIALVQTGHRERAEALAIRAESITASLTDYLQERDHARNALLYGLIELGDHARVQNLASSIRAWRRDSLFDLGCAVTAAGESLWARVIGEDLLSERHVSDSGRVMAAIATGDYQLAETLARAFETDAERRADALLQIAKALVGAGQLTHARDLAIEAAKILPSIRVSPDQQVLLRSLTCTQIAVRQFDHAEAGIRELGNTMKGARLKVQLVAAAVAAGEHDRAQRIADGVATWAHEFTNERWKPTALADAADALTTAGQSDRARHLAVATEVLARTISDPVRETDALIRFASALAAAGYLDRARHACVDAEKSLRKIDAPWERAERLGPLINAAIAAADYEHATSLLTVDVVEHAVSQIGFSPEVVGEAARPLVAALVATGQYSRAESLVNAFDNADVRNYVVQDLVTGLVDRDEYDLAKALARTHPEDRMSQSVLAKIAVRLAIIGDHDRARAVAQSVTHPWWQGLISERFATLIASPAVTDDADISAGDITSTRHGSVVRIDETEQIAEYVRQATALLSGGEFERAEEFIGAITVPEVQAEVLAAVALACVPGVRAKRFIARACSMGSWSLPIAALAANDKQALIALDDDRMRLG